MGEPITTAPTRIESRPTGSLAADRGANACYPSPAGPYRHAQGRGLRRDDPVVSPVRSCEARLDPGKKTRKI
jgi:hypothetical protein